MKDGTVRNNEIKGERELERQRERDKKRKGRERDKRGRERETKREKGERERETDRKRLKVPTWTPGACGSIRRFSKSRVLQKNNTIKNIYLKSSNKIIRYSKIQSRKGVLT